MNGDGGGGRGRGCWTGFDRGMVVDDGLCREYEIPLVVVIVSFDGEGLVDIHVSMDGMDADRDELYITSIL